MAFLTDRSLASGVTPQDLIHIVIPTDISQNPAGSSYKATIGQVLSGFTGTTIYEEGLGSCSTQRIGVGADASGNYSVVSGGYCNTVCGNYSFLGGGYCNTVSGYYSTLSGGYCNTASNYYSTVSGGYHNTASCAWATVSGGYFNTSETYSTFIGGGGRNTTSGWYSTISGGRLNTATGACSTIAGGCNNTVACILSSIGGGRNNVITCNGSTISGGYNNFVGGIMSSVLGGSGNTVNHNYSSAVGFGVTSVSASTFHINYLALQNTPETDVQTYTQYLTRDSATGVVKTKLNPGPTVYGLFSQTGDSVVVSATTGETTLIDGGVGTLIVPSNGFTIGDSFRVKMGGVISNPSNHDIRIRLKSGLVVLGDSLLQNLVAHSNDNWILDVDFIIRNIGGAGTASIMTLGSFATTKKNSGGVEGFSFETLNDTTFDTTGPNTLDITVEWGQVDTGDVIYSRTFVLNKVY